MFNDFPGLAKVDWERCWLRNQPRTQPDAEPGWWCHLELFLVAHDVATLTGSVPLELDWEHAEHAYLMGNLAASAVKLLEKLPANNCNRFFISVHVWSSHGIAYGVKFSCRYVFQREQLTWLHPINLVAKPYTSYFFLFLLCDHMPFLHFLCEGGICTSHGTFTLLPRFHVIIPWQFMNNQDNQDH